MLYMSKVTNISEWVKQEVPDLVVEWEVDRFDIWACVENLNVSLALEKLNELATTLKMIKL